jgi:hypothetical protein
MFRQISPFMAADFEFRHIPSGIVMCRPVHDPELGFVAGGVGRDVDGELDFEEFHGFAPLDLGLYGDVGGLIVVDWGEADG